MLTPHKQCYSQSHCDHKELILERNTSENNPMYQLSSTPYYITTRNTHRSILRHYHFLDLGIKHILPPAGLLIWTVRTIFRSLYGTWYCIPWNTFNRTFQTSIFTYSHSHRDAASYYQSFYSPTEAQVNCLENSFKIYIEVDIKTAPTCFGAVTPSSGSALFELAKVYTC